MRRKLARSFVSQTKQLAASLIEEIERGESDAESARVKTRWLPLGEKDGIIDYYGWASAWARRDLEKVVGSFTDEARYDDITFRLSATGKGELRSVLSRLFHSSALDMTMEAAHYDPATKEVELHWERSGVRVARSPIPKHPMGISVRGRSLLQIAERKIQRCVDRWNDEDLSLIYSRPKLSREM